MKTKQFFTAILLSSLFSTAHGAAPQAQGYAARPAQMQPPTARPPQMAVSQNNNTAESSINFAKIGAKFFAHIVLIVIIASFLVKIPFGQGLFTKQHGICLAVGCAILSFFYLYDGACKLVDYLFARVGR